MITGYNTDVEHDGVVYHVQTEDKGLETPLILSLVYSGGAILASKRSPYEDLIASGFSDEALSERLKRQHLLICAAIHAGRVGDLKRMGSAEAELASVESPGAVESPPIIEAEKTTRTAADQVAEIRQPPAAIPAEPLADTYTIHDQRRQSPLGDFGKEAEGLRITLLQEQEFRAGDSLTLRILVSHLSGNSEKPMNGAVVSVKVLGTTFRPLIYSMKTQRDGVATVSAQIPKFTSGRAAILIRALAGGSETELRRIILAS
ncbi:MAG TPA: hypothetical protein VFD48_15745 [Pyrinomonadaceae bacterium]|nr:hypothetical protein [Pyrinomonadaceae bacterium]